MKKNFLSMIVAGGILASATLIVLPSLATGDAPGMKTPSDPVRETVPVMKENVVADPLEILPRSSSLIDFPKIVTVANLPSDAEITDPDNCTITVDGQSYKIVPTLDEYGRWIFDLSSVSIDKTQDSHDLTIPSGFWTCVGNTPTEQLTAHYSIQRKSLKQNTQSGIYGANYTYEDENGIVYGYHLDWTVDNYDAYSETPSGEYRISNAYLCGVKTKNATDNYIRIPAYISTDEIELIQSWGNSNMVNPTAINGDFDITDARFHHDIVNGGIETSFPIPDGVEEKDFLLSDICIPSCIESITWTGKFQTNVRNFHFDSVNVPNITMDEYANGKIYAWVPESLYNSYRDYIKNHYTSYTIVVRSQEPRTPVYVNVNEPGTLASEIVKLVENLETVKYVIVSGTPNEEDLRIFRRMPNLEILNLKNTTGLKTVSGLNQLEYLREVVLPEGIETIGEDTFSSCTSLEKINFPNSLKEIGEHSFYECTTLSEITLNEGLEIIRSGAFYRNRNLTKVNFPSTLKKLCYNSFRNTGIKEADLQYVEEIESDVFNNTNIETVIFSNNLKKLGNDIFVNNFINELIIPSSLVNAGWNVFYKYGSGGGISKITVENSPYIDNWDSGFLSGTYPKEVIWQPLFPTNSSYFSGEDLKNAIVYVPKLTYNEYLLSDAWVNAKDIRPMEEDLNYVYLDRDFTLRSETGLTSDAVFEVGMKKNHYDMYSSKYGHLTVKRKTDLPLKSFSLSGHTNYNNYYDYESNRDIRSMGYYGATFIPESTVTAEEVTLSFALDTERWNFICLPFDVKVSEIEVEDDALWVVRRYSGEDRASLSGNTWVNMQDNEILKAGEGYIFHCSMDNREEVQFTFRPADDNSGLFNADDTNISLKSYPSEFAHNAHWNLTGNSYPAYLSLRALDFDAPVTVWDGNTYNAYSPVDDEYAFAPFQAFFVQLQETDGGDVLRLDRRGRAHSENDAKAIEITDDTTDPALMPARKARREETRALFNISLSGENMSDRTRLVINEAASEAYESSRDASKFMTSESAMPQIFVMNGNARMAIDERPYGEGVYTLGVRIGRSGSYSIAIDGRDIEGYVAILTDNTTGISADITSVPYAFTAQAGEDEGRFTLELRRSVETGVEETIAASTVITAEAGTLFVKAPAEVEISVTAADGVIMASTRSKDFSIELPAGVYVVKAGETVKKINIR